MAAAIRLARVLTTTMRGHHGLWHTYRDGVASVPGFLDDYAFVAQGLFDLHQETLRAEWLEASVALVDEMISLFEDRGDGGGERLGFHNSRANQADVLIRQKEIYDGAEPSGNSVAYGLLSKLGRLLGRSEYLAAAEGVARAFGQRLRAYPSGHTRFMWGMSGEVWAPTEVTVVTHGPTGAAVQDFVSEGGAVAPYPSPAAVPLLAAARAATPQPLLLLVTPDNRAQLAKLAPTVGEMRAPEGAMAAAFVCRNGACGLPLVEVKELAAGLARKR
jgi:uncharacterized protein YyaL (SSP411 family)